MNHSIDAARIRNDFPLLRRRINGKPIVYLDSTATALKPQAVIDAVNYYYTQCTANVFRGIYSISEEATGLYEGARKKVAAFVGTDDVGEIVFTRNTSESLNLFAYTWLPGNVGVGDRVVTTIMEHHSNFVPWQQAAIKNGYSFDIWKTKPGGTLDLADLEKLVTKKTKLLAFTAASNVLGTITPVAQIVKMAKRLNPGITVIVDAAQAVPHMPVDVKAWGADMVAFSGHKMLGPSGIGGMWARRDLLENMPPFLYGGDMIREVHERETLFNDLPHKFEAGTPYIEGAIGLGAAVDYLSALGMANVRAHEKELVSYGLEVLSGVKGLTIYGPKDPEIRGGVISFRMKGVHPHDVAQILDRDNVCVRVGYHCAEPLHESLNCGPTVRASFYVYNTKDDIDALVEGVRNVEKVFA